MAIDIRVEARVGRDVVDADRLATLQDESRDAAVRREPQTGQGFGDLVIFLVDVREVELTPVGVEQQDGRAFGI